MHKCVCANFRNSTCLCPVRLESRVKQEKRTFPNQNIKRKERKKEKKKGHNVCARSYAVSFIIPKPPPPGHSILILPNRFQVNVATSFGTANAPPLPLVFGAKGHCAAASRQIQTAAPSLGIRRISSIRCLSRSLELSLSFGFKRLLLRVRRVGDGFQTRNAGATRPQRRRR